jgi:regulator of cell morphogenesis and NO signaling
VLFPYIAGVEHAADHGLPAPRAMFGSVTRPITTMMEEHDHAGAIMIEIRTLTDGYEPPPNACPTYRAMLFELQEFEKDLHQHVHLENNILFPRALRLEQALQEREDLCLSR